MIQSLKKKWLWFQNWYKQFGEFSPNHSKVQNFHFDFCSKYMFLHVFKVICKFLFKAKKIQRSYLWRHWTMMKNLSKPWPYGFKDNIRNWELSLEHPKAEKLYIDELFLSKAYNVSPRKFLRNYMSWYSRVTQNLKENWLVA